MKRRGFLTALGIGGVVLAASGTLLGSVEAEGHARFPDDTTYPGFLKIILGDEIVTMPFPNIDEYVDITTASGVEVKIVRIIDWNGQDILRIMCLHYSFVELIITDSSKLQEEGLTVQLIEDRLYTRSW